MQQRSDHWSHQCYRFSPTVSTAVCLFRFSFLFCHPHFFFPFFFSSFFFSFLFFPRHRFQNTGGRTGASFPLSCVALFLSLWAHHRPTQSQSQFQATVLTHEHTHEQFKARFWEGARGRQTGPRYTHKHTHIRYQNRERLPLRRQKHTGPLAIGSSPKLQTSPCGARALCAIFRPDLMATQLAVKAARGVSQSHFTVSQSHFTQLIARA